MKFNREYEIRMIFQDAAKSPNALEEMQRLTRLQQILVAEFSDKLSSIWTIGAKVDKLRKDLIKE